MKIPKLFLLIFLIPLVVPGLPAQDTLQTGAVTGTVTDMEKSPLPGVEVTISGPALIQGSKATVTSRSGSFRFTYLPIGKYDLTFALSGFQTLVMKGVTVSLRKTTTANATMEMSTLEETIEVTGEAPVVDVKSSTIGTNFTLDMLQKVPSARDPWVILEMTPGMVMNQQNVGGSTSGSQSSAYAYGSQRSQTSYNIDGLNMTDAAANGASAMYYDFDSFEEIQVETGAHSADIQTGGVVLNMITKSGGNTFSGGVSFYGETESLQSNNIPDEPEYENVGTGNPLDYMYEYGFELGGPILKDRLWFYGAYRRTKINRYIIGYELDGVPQTSLAELSHGTFKLTWQVSNNNKLMGWFNYDNKYMPNRSAGPRRPPETTAYQDSPSYFYHLEDTWTLTPNLLLNFKAGYNNMWYQTAPQDSVDMNQPAVLIYYSEPYRRMYEDAYYTYSWYYSDRAQVTATADYFKEDLLGGDHELKVGFEYNNTPFYTDRKYPGNITLYFDYPDRTGSYRVWTFRQIRWDETNEVYSAFLHDTFSLKNHLTFNIGLRFDSTHMHINESNVPGNEWTDYYTQRTGNSVALHSPERRNVVEWNTLSPRLGMTYDIFGNGSTVLKANLSRYFRQVSYEPVWRVIETGTWEVDYSWDDANGDKLPQTNEFGSIKYVEIAETVSIDPELKSPYTNEAVFAVEQRIGNDFGLSLNLILRQDHREFWTDNLAVDPTRDYTPVTVRDPGPDGDLGTSDDGGDLTVYDLAENKVGVDDPYVTQRPGYKSYFRGVEFVITKKYSNRWQMMASMTLGSNKQTLPIEAVDDPNNREFNDDVPFYNSVPVILKVSGSYELPLGINIGGFLNYRRGYVSQRYFSYSGLNQGRINVETQEFGSERYPDLFILDLRLSKRFELGRFGHIEVMLDGFNVLNSVTTLDWDAESWSGYQEIWEVLAPRILRFGVKWGF